MAELYAESGLKCDKMSDKKELKKFYVVVNHIKVAVIYGVSKQDAMAEIELIQRKIKLETELNKIERRLENG